MSFMLDGNPLPLNQKIQQAKEIIDDTLKQRLRGAKSMGFLCVNLNAKDDIITKLIGVSDVDEFDEHLVDKSFEQNISKYKGKLLIIDRDTLKNMERETNDAHSYKSLFDAVHYVFFLDNPLSTAILEKTDKDDVIGMSIYENGDYIWEIAGWTCLDNDLTAVLKPS